MNNTEPATECGYTKAVKMIFRVQQPLLSIGLVFFLVAIPGTFTDSGHDLATLAVFFFIICIMILIIISGLILPVATFFAIRARCKKIKHQIIRTELLWSAIAFITFLISLFIEVSAITRILMLICFSLPFASIESKIARLMIWIETGDFPTFKFWHLFFSRRYKIDFMSKQARKRVLAVLGKN